MSVAIPFRLVRAVGCTIVRGIDRLARAFKHRKDAAMLAAFDERMLADIGLTRSDLRDAFAEPLWRDPTAVLVDRACERRINRPAMTFGRNGQGTARVTATVAAPSIVPPQSSDSTARAA